MFQSLNWDGVISNGHLPCQSCDFVFVSIPQLGWGDFKQLVRVMGSIAPGFQSLNWDGVISNFGSGVSDSLLEMFQSLNWDGVISNLTELLQKYIVPAFQSLNWDGVISNQNCQRGKKVGI